MRIDYSVIPTHCQDGMRRYIEHRILSGDFLYYVLSNNLVKAFEHADELNQIRMRDYAQFLHSQAPAACWGSREKIKAWIERADENPKSSLKPENDSE